MESTSYVLCAATALACSVLLLRRWRQGRVPLLLWCGLAFLGLAGENAILFVDRILLPPEIDLAPLRNAVGLAGITLLLVGLILESR